MRLHKTGHPIADTVSDLIGEMPDASYDIAYGILRHNHFRHGRPWFEIDKGFYGSGHYDGNYRISFQGTQPRYHANGPKTSHGLILEPWCYSGKHALICPPTSHVSQFFGIDYSSWLMNAVRNCEIPYIIRHKGDPSPVDWGSISQVITFNSTIAVEALRRGIPVISDPVHSTIGCYLSTVDIKDLASVNRDELFSFLAGHMFRLNEKEKLCRLINYYLSSSDTTAEKQSVQMS